MQQRNYDKQAKRKPTVQSKLDAVETRRAGSKQVRLVGESANMLIPVKDCPYCRKASPMIENDARFICRRCVVIFS